MLLLVTAVILLAQLPVGFIVLAQFTPQDEQAMWDSMRELHWYSMDLKSFLMGCGDQMGLNETFSITAISECMDVIDDLNKHYEQVWSEHGPMIEKYKMKADQVLPDQHQPQPLPDQPA
jgi:hypothetical protein